jgi:hypothetical protein
MRALRVLASVELDHRSRHAHAEPVGERGEPLRGFLVADEGPARSLR